MKARFPLREARIEVKEIPGRPGAYNAIAYMRPWLADGRIDDQHAHGRPHSAAEISAPIRQPPGEAEARMNDIIPALGDHGVVGKKMRRCVRRFWRAPSSAIAMSPRRVSVAAFPSLAASRGARRLGSVSLRRCILRPILTPAGPRSTVTSRRSMRCSASSSMRILHHPRVQRFEGSWRGLAWLTGGFDPGRRVKVKVLNLPVAGAVPRP